MGKNIFFEYLKIALQSIKSQALRTILTALIIAIGITALVGILTAIDAIKSSLTGQFALLGANTFTIQNRGPNIRIGRSGERPKTYPSITYYEAMKFKEQMPAKRARTSVSFQATGAAEAKYKNLKTNPNVSVMAADENYLHTGGYELESGRNLSLNDIKDAAAVALIGQDIVSNLFAKEDPLGKFISIGDARYRIVGVLAPKGNSFGFGGDKSLFIPITKARTKYATANRSFAVNVMALESTELESVVDEATATMRAVRKLKPKEETNFNIIKSDSISESLIENLSYVSMAAIIIAAITLLGAAIALMNIMLVSVTERTSEIGIRKAIGAKSNAILSQFLTEAIAICLLGGLAGIIFGILIGNGISMLVGGAFIIPWAWMSLSAIICFLVGLLSGFYPALKASRLDPIESLRYE
ncbi:ABC transporter permease [Croceimicrobium hydrocarbonivorans]|uniref:ABC transporter permease n=1 Tax=Croceimicrobium hydrocarbonivorans TaxID=2761580 RepID=A0A7H0VG55_9FLAO|nr:ABC transporter permease [Croceimicrobium hydrocarbonivorans]QNR24703.1 ABC transporter permease [Croceimicrobium hydrocarbonivorans]